MGVPSGELLPHGLSRPASLSARLTCQYPRVKERVMPLESAALAPIRRGDISRTIDYRHTTNDSAVSGRPGSRPGRPQHDSPAGRAQPGGGEADWRGPARGRAQYGDLPRRPGRSPSAGHVPVEIDTSRRVALGLHIAFRHAILALLDLRGRVIARERIPHQDTDPRRVIPRLAARVTGFVAEHAAGRSPWTEAYGLTK